MIGPQELAFLGQGLMWTLALTAIGFTGGILFGFLVALARVSPIRWISALAAGWIAVFQGTPLLMQLFVVYFGLPLLGLAAGRKLTLEAEGEPAELRVRRPALDAALLALMQDMPAGSPPVLRLRGTRLTPGFPVDAARQDALRAAGVTVEGSVLQLPTRAG